LELPSWKLTFFHELLEQILPNTLKIATQFVSFLEMVVSQFECLPIPTHKILAFTIHSQIFTVYKMSHKIEGVWKVR
jgi:hypothetical protein